MPGHNARNSSDVTKHSILNTPYSMQESEYVDFEEKKKIKMPWPVKNYGKKILIYGAAQEVVAVGMDLMNSKYNIGEIALINLPSAIIYGAAMPLMVNYIAKNKLEPRQMIKTLLVSAVGIIPLNMLSQAIIKHQIDENENEIQNQKKAEPVKPQIQPVDSLQQQGEEMLALAPKAISYQQALTLDY